MSVLLNLASHSNGQGLPVNTTDRPLIFGSFPLPGNKLTDSNKTVGKDSGGYLSYVDSVKASLLFLQQNNHLLTRSNEIMQKVKGSLTQENQLQHKPEQSEEVKAFIQQRKQTMFSTNKISIGYNIK
jgi:hypothetical protein